MTSSSTPTEGKIPLSELTLLIVDCEHKTAPTSETGYPLIRTPNIGRGRFELADVQRVDEATYEEWTRRTCPQPGDLIMAREAPVGNVAVIKGDLAPALGQRTVLIRPDPEHLDSDYLCYRLSTNALRGWMTGVSNGATVPHLNLSDIRNLPLIELPPLVEQRKIGSCLRAFDDLIENNRRRIELLEETARLLYREWFVNFRYPGHEDVALVDSEFGLLPDGWAWLPLSDCPFGLTKPSIEPYEGSKTYLATADVKGLHHVVGGEDMEHSALPSRAQHSPIPNTVWFGRMANYQKLLFFMDGDPTMDKLVLSSGFACLLCPDPWFGFVAGQVIDSSFEDRKQQFATGATQVSLTDAGARRMPWLVPDEGVVSRFEGLIGPILITVTTLRSVNSTLAETRDLLLPRLVSGDLDISDLDLSLEAVG